MNQSHWDRCPCLAVNIMLDGTISRHLVPTYYLLFPKAIKKKQNSNNLEKEINTKIALL